ncbi:OmpA family protein [Parabacteroides goldsteinii]|uniref:OmpA family protein n=1 Tax=Parabacteroides goldsteinii TaxID=328812 RepID=UPI001897EF23|nr:OmpA family protein [Parabacteroides goldsteinii]
MKKLVLILSALLFLIGTTDVQAQWGKKLLKKAGESAKRATERNVEKKIDKAVDKTFDSAEDAVTGKGNDSKSEKKTNAGVQGDAEVIGNDADMPQEPQQPQQSLEMTYAKNDFVPGDEIFFEDLMDNEQLGEFPSMWDLVAGNAEIASINGKKAIYRGDREKGSYTIAPLMKDMKNYLPEKYTIEMDLWIVYLDYDNPETRSSYELHFYDTNSRQIAMIEINNRIGASGDKVNMGWEYRSTSGQSVKGDSRPIINFSGWQHVSISFNQRAFKLYLNGERIINIPNMTQAATFRLRDRNINSVCWGGTITNIRIAKGAVPLYDRMMSDGKFITYGITFDVGKSTIKPESMGEINRIVTLMKENPDLKFSVEGHTDSTGNEASNQTLSEARSKAIVDKLIELGIATDRLTASGKGQSSPIADNGTDEGRAKNRRVEFVKL